MISKISGRLAAVRDDEALVDVGAFEYQVLIPDFTRRQLEPQLGTEVSLFSLQYLEGNPTQGRLIPRLVGFTSEIERQFFELFCSVDGVGMRKALRAMVRPVPDVATLIEEQDAKGLSTLPGIGPATAERIIAKLRRKMSRFALMITEELAASGDVESNIVEDTHQILLTLGHTEVDARRAIDEVLKANPRKKFKDVDTLLQVVYAASRES